MVRLVRTKVEVEGRWTEELVVVDGDDLKPWSRPLDVVGHPESRIDGFERALGRAVYTQDVRLPGLLHARILRSPHAHATIRRIDTRRALALAGVRAVLTHENAPPIPWYSDSLLFDPRLRYAGEEVAAVLADSEPLADAALRLIDVDYDLLPAVTGAEAALDPDAPKLRPRGNLAGGRSSIVERGSIDEGLAFADVRIDATFRTAGALHNALETHGSVAHWEGPRLTLFDSTQYLFGIRQGMADKLGLALADVRVVMNYMGGGFGAKNSVRKYMVIAALFARSSGRPVRCVLDRVEENLSAGHRHETATRVRLGVTKSGKLTALEAVIAAGGGAHANGMMPVGGPFRELYACPNVRTEEKAAQVNLGPQSAFRAPGYAEGAFALESAIDIAARELGIDPVAFRMKNIPRIDPALGVPYTRPTFRRILAAGAAHVANWPRLPRPKGDVVTGRGMAAAIWGVGGGPPAMAHVTVQSDGSLQLVAGTQDLGTGTKTVLAQVAAEEFGCPLAKVRVTLGDSAVAPYAPASWGSMTVASVAPAVRLAAADARTQVESLMREALGKGASRGRAMAGRARTKARGAATRRAAAAAAGADSARRPAFTAEAFRALREALGDWSVIGKGMRWPNPAGKRIAAFAAQWADVTVDRGTGEIRVLRLLSAHDCGRVLNPKLARSQVEGGVLQGLGFALMEGRRIDLVTHRVLNPTLLDYKVPTVRDLPRIEVLFLDEPDRQANNTGAVGLGEPPVIPTAAAIANAVADAAGVRLTETPFTPKRVLDALAALAGEAS